MTVRIVHCEDALKWLGTSTVEEDFSFVASMPDFSEFPGLTLTQWKEWFIEAAHLIMSRCPDEGVSVFYQSDIKHEGVWIDKAYLCQKAAEKLGIDLIWHKIICRAPIGVATFGRPSYSHILCFSKRLRPSLSMSTADVLPQVGDKTWQRGMGLEASLMVAKFIAEQTKTKTVINPFCGQGSMLAAANQLGLNAIGIERSPKRAQKARLLKISSDLKSFISE